MKLLLNLFSYKPFMAGLALAFSLFLGACDDGAAAKKDDLPPAASNLVNPDEGSGALTHTVDSATEFSAALDSFSGAKKPDLRDTGSGSTVIRVEKAPAISKPGHVQDTKKPIEQDWDGTVLIPDGTQMSHAHTTDVKFSRIEAHPLKNGALRVWVRVENITDKALNARVACNFKSATNEMLKTAFIPVEIPASDAIDVYFMSPMPDVVSYTILVR